MNEPGSAGILLFEDFRLDRDRGVLYRLGQGAPVAIGSRAVALLGLLTTRQGEVVSKDEIMGGVWPGRVVEESNLNVQIAKLRHVLDQGRGGGSCIQTLVGRGYCFVVPVTVADTDALLAAPTIVHAEAHPKPHLSIVVLPFANLDKDPNQQYLIDGITEDLTTDLSRLSDVVVISRNTAFVYRDKPVDIKKIGLELGVRYVLEGSIRRSDNRMRVNLQLIDTETDSHVWAERFDCHLSDLFQTQDDITATVAGAIKTQMLKSGQERRSVTLNPPGRSGELFIEQTLRVRSGGISSDLATLKTRYHLVIVSPPDAARRIPLYDIPLSIGRTRPSDVVLPHSQVSRTHCQIQIVDGRVEVLDLNSTNGTYVDGQKTDGQVPLLPGGTLRIGPYSLTLELV